MAWIESHQELKDHPKLFRLAGDMGWEVDMAIGKLHRFWWWCLSYAPNGDLRKFNDGQIALGMGVAISEGSRLVEALVQSCWVDREPYFRVHDWWDYVGSYLKVKFKDHPEKWRSVQNSYKPEGKGKQDKETPHPTEYETPPVTAPVTEGATRITGPNQPDQPNQIKKGIRDESKRLAEKAEEIYAFYPHKVGKPAALRAIGKAMEKVDPEVLLGKTKAFSEVWNGDKTFCPHPSTWFNQERYNDDPTTWKRSNGQAPLHVQREAIMGKIARHPANSESECYDPDCPTEKKQEFRELKRRLAQINDEISGV